MITRFTDRSEVVLANDDSSTITTTVGLWPFQTVESSVFPASETFEQISYLSSLHPVIVTSDTSAFTFVERPDTRNPACCSCQ